MDSGQINNSKQKSRQFARISTLEKQRIIRVINNDVRIIIFKLPSLDNDDYDQHCVNRGLRN